MIRRLLQTSGLAAAVVWSSLAGQAQVPDKAQASSGIDQATVSAVIDEALKQLDENYVFPEVAAKMATAVRQHVADKKYAEIKSGQALADLLTRHFQEISKDKHLRVRYSAEKLPAQPKEQLAPTPEMRERMKLMVKSTNAGYRKVERMGGNVGYLAIDGFMDAEFAAEPAAAAMNFLAGTDALIIDLRRNGGGSPTGVALLCSYFFDEKPVHLNSLYWRRGDRTEEFWTRKDLAGKRYLKKDVYLLTSSRTFSAAEEFTYNLQNQKRVTIVGETTGGGAHPGGIRRLNDHFSMFVPTGRAINPISKTNWEGTGVKPDVEVPADKALEKAHELAVKKLQANAKDEETRRRIQQDLERSRTADAGPARPVQITQAANDINKLREVADGVLLSSAMPAVKLKFPKEFKYVGGQSFVLYGVANAEQHFFADTDAEGKLKRFYWVQFEGYLQTNKHSYNYKKTRTIDIGGLEFVADASARNVAADPGRPDSDGNHARKFLASKGLKMPGDDVLIQRLVHIVDEAKRNELMIIYAEDLSDLKLTAKDLAPGGSAAGKWEEISKALLERAAKGIEVVK